MTFAEADAIPPVVSLREPQLFRAGDIAATIPAGYLTRDQIVVLRLIRDSYPSRPLYFSAAEYGNAMGLGPYLLTQGLITKLEPHAITASKDTMRIQGSYFDLPTSLALWDSVYLAPHALIRQNGWVDGASVGIGLHYAILGSILAQSAESRGDTARARVITDTVDAMARSARLQRALGGGR